MNSPSKHANPDSSTVSVTQMTAAHLANVLFQQPVDPSTWTLHTIEVFCDDNKIILVSSPGDACHDPKTVVIYELYWLIKHACGQCGE